MILKVRLRLDNSDVTYNVNRGRVKIRNFRRKVVLACYNEHSLLRLL